MLYFVYIKKSGIKDKYSKVTKVIECYTRNIGPEDICVSLPGYMSASKNTIDEFKRRIKISDYLFFTKGMNGDKKILVNNKYITLQEYNNSLYSGEKIITAKVKGNYKETDHSKILFFLDKNSSKELKVKAILIGSSNQSYNTYFKSNSRGESDILIIDEEALMDSKNIIYNDGIINKNSNIDNDSKVIEMFEEVRDDVIISKEISDNKGHLTSVFNDTVEIEFKQ